MKKIPFVRCTMGSKYSRSRSSEENPQDSYDPNLPEYCFPENVLIEILSHVSASDLLNNCTRVCQQWYELISVHGLWKKKCLRDGKTIPPVVLPKIPKNYYRRIYLYNPYGRNFLRNPYGEDNFRHWVVEYDSGDGWKIENPPEGAANPSKQVGTTHCFVTSYRTCSKYQTIDLYKEGLTAEMMEVVHPPISMGEWHAARFDCGSVYNLDIYLLDDLKKEIHRFQHGPMTEVQWVGKLWSQLKSTIRDYPRNIRYIVFKHSGQDTQFWAGHYGSKMTGGFVKFDFDAP